MFEKILYYTENISNLKSECNRINNVMKYNWAGNGLKEIEGWVEIRGRCIDAHVTYDWSTSARS